MSKRFLGGMLATAMLCNITAFAQISETNGVYRENFEGYESDADIIADKTIIKEYSKYEPALGENGGSSVMVVNSASGADNTIFTNGDLFDNELTVMKFKMGADASKQQNWGSTSSLVINHTNDSGIVVNDYIFDFAYSLIRHKLGGTTEKGICGFSSKKMYGVELKIAKAERSGKYYYDVIYLVDGIENKISYPTTADGTMKIGFKSTAGNTVYVDDIEVQGYTYTRASVNVAGRTDVSVIPTIEVEFTDVIDTSMVVPADITVGSVVAEDFVALGENKYQIVISETLKKNTSYTVDLESIRDMNGNPLENGKFTFKTKNSAVIIDGSYVVNTSKTDAEDIIIVFPDSVLATEIYEKEKLRMSKSEFAILTGDYRPVVATSYAENTGIKADAFTAEFDSESQLLKVSGKTESAVAEELLAVSLVNERNKVVYAEILKTDENGYFSTSYAPTLVSGVYTVNARTMQEEMTASVRIRSGADITAVLDVVKTQDPALVLGALEEYSDVLLIDLDLYENLQDKSFIAQEIAKLGEYSDIDKLVDDIKTLSLVDAMRTSQDVYTLFSSYDELVLSEDDKGYEIWDELTQENKTAVLEGVIASQVYAPSKIAREIYVRSLYKMIETTNKYIDVKNAIEQYPDLLGISLEDYNELGQPASVAKDLCTKTWSTGLFASEFNALVSALKAESENPPAGNGGSTGGSTGGGSFGGGGSSGGGGGSSGGSSGGASSGGGSSSAGKPGGNIASPIETPSKTPEPMGTPAPSEPETVEFADLGSVAWAEEAITSLAERKIISGYDDGSFRPDGLITREEFVSIIVRYFGLDTGAECDFGDVSKDAWYYRSVAEAYKKGIIRGITEEEFGTGLKISRQDAAVILYNIGGFAKAGELQFADSGDIADYAKDAVSALVENGIVNGVSDSEFAPQSPLTRAQAAQLLYTYDLKKEADK